MTKFQLMASLATLTALTAFANQVFFKLRGSLGMTVAGASISLLAFVAGMIWPAAGIKADAFFTTINYADTVFHGLLCFLLFAGAMHVDLRVLYRWKITVSLLATVGVLCSTVVVAFSAHLLCRLGGIDIPFIWLMVFGALISPTDPVAVLALLKELNAPKDLETKLAAEGLLNDGTAIVVFSVCLSLALAMSTTVREFTMMDGVSMFFREAVGGAGLGIVMGLAGNYLLKLVNDPPTEVVMTLAYALGGYALGEALHVSGPMVAAVMGLIVGHGRHTSMESTTKEKLLPFWEMFDELLNMVLFMLVGLSLLALPDSWVHIATGAGAIICALLGRFISVSTPLALISRTIAPIPKGTTQVMVWGGVRGGVSLAMALSLPESPYKPYLVSATWAVVMFSLLVQAPTMGWVMRKSGMAAQA